MEELRNSFKWLAIATIFLYVAVVLAATAGYLSVQHRAQENRNLIHQVQILAKEGQQAHEGECVLKEDLRDRIQTSVIDISNAELYLAKHPDGVGGITKTDIITALNVKKDLLKSQKRTLSALSVVKCD